MYARNLLLRNATLFSRKTAVSCMGENVTYKGLLERVSALSSGLASLGLQKGDRIAFLGHNSLAFVEFHIGVSMGGMVAVPLNFRLAAKELQFILNDCSCKALIYDAPYVQIVERIREEVSTLKHFISLSGSGGEDVGYEQLISRVGRGSTLHPEAGNPAAILYTSGTTGVPKGALLSHHNMLAAIKGNLIEQQIVPENKFLGVGPLFHVAPLHILLAFLYRGCTCIILQQFDPRAVLETIQNERITNIFLVPATLKALVDFPDLARYDLSSLSTVTYGGAPTPKELVSQALKTFGPVLLQVYGSTETGLTTVLDKNYHEIKDANGEHAYIRSCGREIVDFMVRTVDERGNDIAAGEAGEILVKGESVMQGYWKKPEETEKVLVDGWFRTGDVGTLDDTRLLTILDRKKDVIISGGENIYPAEIESLISSLPQVAETAVIGVPDERWGETVKALVVLKEGQTLSVDEIIDACKRHLASYKKPTSVDFLGELPKNSTGKILKRVLKERYGKTPARTC